MFAFISLISEILSINLTIGTVTFSLGGVLGGVLIMRGGLMVMNYLSDHDVTAIGDDIENLFPKDW